MGDQKGLYEKYNISKADGTPVDPNGRYFILRYDNSWIARQALRTYAGLIGLVNLQLMKDLHEELDKYDKGK